MNVIDRLLDKSIVFSFDKSGFERHRASFADPELRVDLTGRRMLVTGANSGLGFATTRALAERGATVYMLCRSVERGEAAKAELSGDVQLERIDVSDLGDVRRFAERFEPDHVDVLIHNAGVLPNTRTLTPDGLEQTWATNVVGPFLLTHLMRSRLAASDDARIVNVSSGGMYTTRLTTSDTRWEQRDFDGVQAYAETKRAEVVLTEQWAERLAPEGIAVHAMHPGWADTPGVKTSIPRFHQMTKHRLRTWEQGADTTVWLAASPEVRGVSGKFYFDRREAPTHIVERTKETASQRDALWARCCEDAGIEV
ncbi:MAG: SDR family NAD(P)-dependent oxidoreductase [Deltaproteobacteria bacterium]